MDLNNLHRNEVDSFVCDCRLTMSDGAIRGHLEVQWIAMIHLLRINSYEYAITADCNKIHFIYRSYVYRVYVIKEHIIWYVFVRSNQPLSYMTINCTVNINLKPTSILVCQTKPCTLHVLISSFPSWIILLTQNCCITLHFLIQVITHKPIV